MANQNLELALKIKALVEGLNNVKGLANDVQKLQGQSKTPMGDPTKPLQDGVRKTSEQVSGLKRLLLTALGIAGVQQGLSQLAQMADAYKKFNAQIKLGIGDQGDFAAAQREVGRIADDNLVSLEAIGKLYGRMAGPILRLGKSQEEVGKTTEAVALSLRISGATAEESASAILQFSQSLASGVLRGEEFNAVNEAAPRLMLALAESMGVPREELRGMAEQGLLTSELLATALPAALGKLRSEAETLPTTVGGSFQVLRNEMLKAVGEADKAVGISDKVGRFIQGIANNLNVLAGVLTGMLTAAFTGLAAAAATNLGAIAVSLRGLLALVGGPVGLVVSIAAAALAWVGFRKSATAELDKVIAKQRELNALQDKGLSAKEAADPRKQEIDLLTRQLAQKRAELADAERYSKANGLSSTGTVGQGIARLRQEINLAENAIADLEAASAASDAEDAAREAEIRRLLDEAKNAAAKADKDKKNKKTGEPFDRAVAFSDDIAKANAAADEELKALAEAKRLIDEKKQNQQDFLDGLEQESFLSGLSNDERETALMLLEAEKLGITDINRLLDLQGTIRANNQAKAAEEELKRQEDTLYESVQSGVQRAFSDGLNSLATGEGGWRGALQNLVDTIRNAMSNALAGSLADGFLGLLGGKEGVLGIAGAIGLGGKRDGSNPANAVYVQDVATAKLPTVGGDGKDGGLFAGIGDLFSKLIDGVKSAFNSIVSWIGGLFSGSGGGGGGGTDWGGIVKGIASLFGYADGGYTGAGGKYQPAGVVHRGEYVFSADSVRSLGLPALDLLHRLSRGIAAPTMPRLGYADGGLVNLPAGGGDAAAQSLRMVLVDDQRNVGNYIQSAEGERVLVQTLRRNAMAIKQILR
ncbi:MAG: tape measure protein [Thiobacillus sp.]|uniref:tape measure protein n=1 Tax=Thiobacillus sp. TaxID=924 RepID=UPI0028942403|nr:tape measure protein [Thiobacillus sp.]MDT3707482.1 tape measure protein [Thiobacillus sp.]